jgi:hypothetical protein
VLAGHLDPVDILEQLPPGPALGRLRMNREGSRDVVRDERRNSSSSKKTVVGGISSSAAPQAARNSPTGWDACTICSTRRGTVISRKGIPVWFESPSARSVLPQLEGPTRSRPGGWNVPQCAYTSGSVTAQAYVSTSSFAASSPPMSPKLSVGSGTRRAAFATRGDLRKNASQMFLARCRTRSGVAIPTFYTRLRTEG